MTALDLNKIVSIMERLIKGETLIRDIELSMFVKALIGPSYTCLWMCSQAMSNSTPIIPSG
jgi:hypothetical protein